MALPKNTFAVSAHLFERVVRKIDFDTFDDLQHLMIAFPHVRMREGFKLDAYMAGSKQNAVMKLYARALKTTSRYMPVDKEEMDSPSGSINWGHIDLWGNSPDEKKEVIPFVEGQYIHNTIPSWASDTVPSVANYLELQFTPKAIWEAVMLVEASTLYLDHRWHGCYNNGMLVVDNVSLLIACLSAGIDCGPLVDDNRLQPSVDIISDTEATVRYCYWNQWIGVVRNSYKVIRKEKGIALEDLGQDFILKYHSRKRY